jgi:hypothetical protein
MSDSPDTEVAFRNPDNIEDTGAQGDDDRFYDTVEDHGTYRRDRGEGDVPDIGKGAHGFNRIDLDGNGTYYPTGSSYRIAIKPESYDGVEVWEEYISHFDICAELGKWRDQDKVLALAAALKGPARTFYISLSQTEKRSYHILVQRLGQRFGSKQEKTYRRMSELLKHTEKRHQSLTDDVKTSSFFSEANGFWLSIHPEDYARLIKPTEYDTILAIRTRAACTFCSSIDGLLGEYGGFPDVGCSWICFLDLSCVFHPSSHCCLDLLDVPVRSSHRLTAALVLIARIVS